MTLQTSKILHKDFHYLNNFVYIPCGFEIVDFKIATESQEYGACNYRLNYKLNTPYILNINFAQFE